MNKLIDGIEKIILEEMKLSEPFAEVFSDKINAESLAELIASLLTLDEEKMLEAIEFIGSTNIPIGKINGKIYHYMNKEDVVKALINSNCITIRKDEE